MLDQLLGGELVQALVAQPGLADLPAATIVLAQIDPLRSEGELFAKKLRDACNDVILRKWKGEAQRGLVEGLVRA